MAQLQLGKLERKDPREIWQREAQEFTPWLADNLTLLNEALGLEIELIQTEMPVGEFAVDIFGKEVGSDREVIVENQLGPTDHGHLGQLLTYAAGLEAKIVIWISPRFRDEHSQAVDWLNRHTTQETSFFAVELELLTIDNSAPAPHFKVVAQPSEWQKEIATERKQERSARQIAFHEFFTDLLSRLKTASPGYTTSSRVGYDSWMTFGAGRSGFSFNPAFVSGNRFRVELYIDTGDRMVNKLAFSDLKKKTVEIEEAVGEPLAWDSLESRRACRIFVEREASTGSPPDILEDAKEWAVKRLIRFKEVFGPHLKAMPLGSRSEALLP